MNAEAPASGRAASTPASPPDSNDPIVRGVVAGGQVVDDWIRQAQQAARLMGGTLPNGSWPDTSSRMFRAASDFMASWVSMVSGPLQAGPAPWFTSPPPPASSAHGGGAAAAKAPASPARHAPGSSADALLRQRVRLEVSSRRAVALSLDVHRNGTREFRVLDLRSEDGNAPRIGRLELTLAESDWLTLRVAVPDDQPTGTYHGVVLDAAADCAIGTVTLRILE
jgi:hypothetical protein